MEIQSVVSQEYSTCFVQKAQMHCDMAQKCGSIMSGMLCTKAET